MLQAGPNFSGDYTLIRARGDLGGIAAKELQIAQTENVFTIIEISSDGRSKSGRFPFSAEFVDDGDNGKVKAWFSWANKLVIERRINLRSSYYGKLDTFSELGNGNIRLRREGFSKGNHGTESRSGCASYARQ